MNDLVVNVMQEPLQQAAVVLITLIFLMALLGINSTGKFLSAISIAAPTILTSVGMFFTFLGIFIALQNFNVESINAAIPSLLGGLKLAFFSSVLGLGAALFFRFCQPSLKKDAITGEVTAGDLLVELRSLNENTGAVHDALAGEGDASLSTQIGKLRNDFRDFADKVTKDSTSALVEALEAVIRDFNEKISEQFGENFKELNKAVGGLLDWQQEYKSQVQQLTEAFQESQRGIETVRQSIERIEESSKQIPAHMDSIDVVFKDTQERVQQLHEGLESLSVMRSNAEEAVPFIQGQIDGLTNGLKDAIDVQMQFIQEELGSMKETQTETRSQLTDMTRGLSELMKSSLGNSEAAFNSQMAKFQGVLDNLNLGADNVLESTEKVGKKVHQLMEDFTAEQTDNSAEIKRRIDESLSDNTETLNQSFQALDKGMQEQLQRSLDKMGNNLAAITDKFVETYESSAGKIVDLTSRITP